MVIGKIKPTATIVAQFAAGVEVEAIQHDGRMFLPVVSMGDFTTKESSSVKDDVASPASTPTKKETNEGAEKPKSESKKYTEDELMETSTKELLRICKEEFGINPDDKGGKNTNKKLRGLILDAQENSDDSATDKDNTDEVASDSDSDSSDEGKDDMFNDVADILEDFDAGKKNKKKAIAAICALSDDADKDAVVELIEKFEEDTDVDIDEIAESIVKVLKSEEKETKKTTSRRKRSKDEDDEELVDVEDLEVGDRVSVWWDDDNKEWFDGEVKSIKKGKVIIAYDDDTEEAIDKEIHTKIKRLAE